MIEFLQGFVVNSWELMSNAGNHINTIVNFLETTEIPIVEVSIMDILFSPILWGALIIAGLIKAFVPVA